MTGLIGTPLGMRPEPERKEHRLDFRPELSPEASLIQQGKEAAATEAEAFADQLAREGRDDAAKALREFAQKLRSGA